MRLERAGPFRTPAESGSTAGCWGYSAARRVRVVPSRSVPIQHPARPGQTGRSSRVAFCRRRRQVRTNVKDSRRANQYKRKAHLRLPTWPDKKIAPHQTGRIFVCFQSLDMLPSPVSSHAPSSHTGGRLTSVVSIGDGAHRALHNGRNYITGSGTRQVWFSVGVPGRLTLYITGAGRWVRAHGCSTISRGRPVMSLMICVQTGLLLPPPMAFTVQICKPSPSSASQIQRI